jgi:uncharacterized protein
MSEHLFQTKVVEMEKPRYDNPIVIGGFVGPGLVGIVTVSYVIEQLNLHEVAHVKSQHIAPVAVFVGERLRHPFRIYTNENGKLVVVVCEVPIDQEGLYEISSIIMDWIEQINAREIVILDGIPVQGIPEEREAFCVAEEGKCKQIGGKGIGHAPAALIGGMGGSILNECLTRRRTGMSLLTPASINLPDPGAALTLINALNSAFDLHIDTKPLEDNVEQLNQYLNTMAEQYRKLQERRAPRGGEGQPQKGAIYG